MSTLQTHNYAAHIASSDELAPYMPPHTDQGDIASQIQALHAQQLDNWPDLRERTEQLHGLRIRQLHAPGISATIQYNPARKRNTADFGRHAVAQRPCFLDADNLPPQERVLAYGDFVIACNPYPVLPQHLTVMHYTHQQQSLILVLSTALRLAHDLRATHSVFYNGPEMGASAPDHAHVQAAAHVDFPIDHDIRRAGKGEPLITSDNLVVYCPDNLGRSVVIIESSNATAMVNATLGIVNSLPPGDEYNEPKLCALWRYIPGEPVGKWVAYLFPRTSYRPRSFYNGTLLVSPAALEVAGFIPVPRPDDFAQIDANDLPDIFRQVSMPRIDVLRRLSRLQ